MKKIIQSIEKIGKSGSINQFDSVEEMMQSMNIEANIFEEASLLSRDLICSMDPGDDDED